MRETTDSDKGGRGDDGFTLVELCVVVLVVGILLALSLVTFVAAQERAAKRAAQARVRDGLVAEKTFAANNAGFADADALRNSRIEPGLSVGDFAASSTHVKGVVYVRNASETGVELVSKSTHGKCYWIQETSTGTWYATTTAVGGVCVAPSVFGSSW